MEASPQVQGAEGPGKPLNPSPPPGSPPAQQATHFHRWSRGQKVREQALILLSRRGRRQRSRLRLPSLLQVAESPGTSLDPSPPPGSTPAQRAAHFNIAGNDDEEETGYLGSIAATQHDQLEARKQEAVRKEEEKRMPAASMRRIIKRRPSGRRRARPQEDWRFWMEGPVRHPLRP
eukprot:gnl/TRDRNA2_/TRDRNA2_94239_c0_seq1.p2 gnl/TRDRNA2_/TRDRNA2_94239_c0~~gnl/TRDRNA2_/TRDRNA2_94239_c0_seq1.p2  ORF type:complete len:176 (-),score=31.31 gnl/TRDRNA2_/TRDRNA2_94239_c0_seq1:262-789(-)